MAQQKSPALSKISGLPSMPRQLFALCECVLCVCVCVCCACACICECRKIKRRLSMKFLCMEAYVRTCATHKGVLLFSLQQERKQDPQETQRRLHISLYVVGISFHSHSGA